MTEQHPEADDRQMTLVEAMQSIDDWVVGLAMDREMHQDDPDWHLDESLVAGRLITNQQLVAHTVLALTRQVEEQAEVIQSQAETLTLFKKGLLELDQRVRDLE